jgi:hypothetical protein
VTGVASLILLADIGDQRLRPLHLDFERGDQRIFRVNDDMSRFPLKFKADRKLHYALPLSMFQKTAQFSCEVELLGPVRFSICANMTKPTTGDQLWVGKTCIVLHELLNQSLHIGNVVVWPKLDWQAAERLNREG